MKKITLAILSGFMCLTSCSDFLTRENPNKINRDEYFTDENSLKIYTNGLIRSYAPEIKDFIDGDKHADTHSWDGSYAYLRDNYTPEEASNWAKGNWSKLRSINFYLDHMREAEGTEAVLSHYEGVGRFFRAMFYFDKMKTFGAVPIYTSSITPEDEEALYKTQDSREDVARFILEDLDFACDNCLADESFRNRAGYIHKYVALTLKARFCLYEGTYRKYHNVDPSTMEPWKSDESEMYLKECVDACEKIIKSKVYRLYDVATERKTQYRAMFTCADAVSKYACEIIWARDYDEELKVTYAINDYMVNSQHANYAFTRQFIDTYLMLDGTPFTDKAGYDEFDFISECEGRDYRLAQTIRTPGFTRDNGRTYWAPDIKFSKTGYQPIKWLTDDSTKDLNTSAIASDVPIMRYAEVLLDYAEAKAELGMFNENIWDQTIKPLRARAGVTPIYPTSADPYMVEYFQNKVSDPFILEIRRERGIELTMEDQRWDDIMRWHQGELLARPWKGIWIEESETPLDLDGDDEDDTIVTKNANLKSELNILYIDGAKQSTHKLSHETYGNILPFCVNSDRSWHDYKYVFPIPATALMQNPNLVQNKGWQ